MRDRERSARKNKKITPVLGSGKEAPFSPNVYQIRREETPLHKHDIP
jgi:hypothetical protein